MSGGRRDEGAGFTTFAALSCAGASSVDSSSAVEFRRLLAARAVSAQYENRAARASRSAATARRTRRSRRSCSLLLRRWGRIRRSGGRKSGDHEADEAGRRSGTRCSYHAESESGARKRSHDALGQRAQAVPRQRGTERAVAAPMLLVHATRSPLRAAADPTACERPSGARCQCARGCCRAHSRSSGWVPVARH